MNENGRSPVVGFIGLGHAGGPMAGRLVEAGYDLVVTDRDESRIAQVVAEHGARAASGADDLADAEVVFTMLPHGGVVREVLLGSGGVAQALRPGTIVVDTSSSDPLGTRALSAELAARDIALVDAAVSEAKVGDAVRGGITFMVGVDDEAALERVLPLLQAMSTHIFHVGPSGAGHAMKTLNNFISASCLHAVLDAVIAANAYGIHPMRMLDVFNVSTASSLSSEGTIRDKALPRTFEPRYTLGLLAKDMGIAAALAHETGFETELFGVLAQAFADARDVVGPEEDLSASLRRWEHHAHTELPAYPLRAPEPYAGTTDIPASLRSVGFVGLGNAGWPMAANMAQVVPHLIVHDADVERAGRFAAEHGVALAESPGELAGVDLLLTMLPQGHAVRSVLLDEGRLAEQLRPGTIVVDTSSSDPAHTRELARELGALGLRVVDAPVSVPDLDAFPEGRITFMVGADDEEAFALVAPLLAHMGRYVFHMGPVTCGHATKTLNNFVSSAGIMGALDGLIVGQRYGLDPAAMIDVLNVSTGRNFATMEVIPKHALRREFNAGFSLALAVKDMRIAEGLAERLGIDGTLFELTRRRFEEALEEIGDQDVSASLLHWETLAGEQLVPAG